MRIAIVTDFYYPTPGWYQRAWTVRPVLTELGHEVTVVTGRRLGAPPVQDDAMVVPEPTFEVATIGISIRLYVPGCATGARPPIPSGRIRRRAGRVLPGAWLRRRARACSTTRS
jgi:hypothetical protein